MTMLLADRNTIKEVKHSLCFLSRARFSHFYIDKGPFIPCYEASGTEGDRGEEGLVYFDKIKNK
jgi:hypothetical protein